MSGFSCNDVNTACINSDHIPGEYAGCNYYPDKRNFASGYVTHERVAPRLSSWVESRQRALVLANPAQGLLSLPRLANHN